MENPWPKTLPEAVKVCLLTLNMEEKVAIKNTLEKDLFRFHFSLALNIRNQFGLWQGNNDLIQSCLAFDPDHASMVIVRAVWGELNKDNG